MSAEISLYNLLSKHPGLTALVGGLGEDARIYPSIMPQNALCPAVTYNRVSTMPISALGSDTSLTRYRFQIDVWAETFGDAEEVADQAQKALQRQSDDNGFEDIYIEDRHADYDSRARLHRVILEILPWVSNNEPTSTDIPRHSWSGAAIGDTLTITYLNIHFSDPDGDPLTYSVEVDDLSVATVDGSQTGPQFDITLTAIAYGSVKVSITATDDGGLSASASFELNITA